MEQRSLRLGDIVDDYCPRERRLTNHAIVAIVEDAIRQTRCTTCDTEHVYKEGKEPAKRRKTGPGSDESGRGQLVAPRSGGPPTPEEVILEAVADADTPAEVPPSADGADAALEASPPAGSTDVPPADEPPADGQADDGWSWMAHRQLIRATLPRVEGEPAAPRPIPEFTMHQRPAGRRGQGQGARFNHGQGRDGNVGGRADGNRSGDAPNGNRAGRGGRSGRRRGPQKRSR